MSIAFVAGATGYTGREVVRCLSEKRIQTIAHVRPDSSRLEDWRHRFSMPEVTVDTTVWEESAMTDAISRIRPTHVFSLLGTTQSRMKKVARETQGRVIDDYEQVDFGLTAMLINACIEAEIKPRFLYLSAVGVKESAGSAYYKARWKAERMLIESGLEYTIARPSFIIGPDRDDGRFFENLAAYAFDGALAFASFFGARKFRDRYHSTSNKTLAQALVRIAFDPKGANAVVESESLHG